MAPVPAVLTQTLPEKIAAELAEHVISGRYQAGERLIESALVKSFNVSHGPVRDALRILQNSGLVTIHPYRGAQVTELTVREVKEIFQVRAALVGLRARWLAEDTGRHELIAQVEQSIGHLTELARTPRTQEEYIQAALALNRAMTERLSNRWLRNTLQALTLQTSRYTRLALAAAERRKASAVLWRSLLKSIQSGDGARAQRIASRISLATRDAAIKYLEAAARLLLADREKKACLAGCATRGLRGNGGAACKLRMVDRLACAGIHCDLCEKCV